MTTRECVKMGFLKKLFGGGSAAPQDGGMYFYIKLNRTEEIVRLRLATDRELNPEDEGDGYVSHKLIVGPKSFKRSEATFYFDANRQYTNAEVEGGELTTEAAWQ